MKDYYSSRTEKRRCDWIRAIAANIAARYGCSEKTCREVAHYAVCDYKNGNSAAMALMSGDLYARHRAERERNLPSLLKDQAV
jgi:hypothetical protein